MEKTVTHKAASLPPVKTLFTDSWEMFKGSLLNVFILCIIAIVVFVVVFAVGIIIAIPLGLLSIFSGIMSNQLTPAFFASLGGLGIIAGILIIISVIMNIVFQAATILVVANYKEKPQIGASIKQGFSFVVPLFLATIVTGFIIAGGYFLFIIPGILFQVALYFVMYEIILSNKGVIAACKRSMGIVFANFWGILGRVLLLVAIVYAVSFIPSLIAGSSNNDALEGIVSFFTSIFSFLVSFYSISYAVTLYKQAEKAAPANKTGSLMWPFVASLIGWILGVVLIVGMLYAVFSFIIPSIQNAAKNKETMKMMQEIQKGEDMDPNMILQMLPTGSPERAQLQKEIDAMEEYNESGSNASNSMMMR